MSNHAVANRYAVALFQLAKEKNLLEPMEKELQLLKAVFSETPELKKVLEHPKVSLKQKKELLEKGFQNSISAHVFHTLELLLERNRIDILESLIDKVQDLAYEERNVASAKVYTVKPLSGDVKAELATTFAKKVGKSELIIDNIVDSELIGGIKIRIGNRIFDGSIKGQLDRLERQLVAGTR